MRVLLFLLYLCCSWRTTQSEFNHVQRHMVQNWMKRIDGKVTEVRANPCCYPDPMQAPIFVYDSKSATPVGGTVYTDIKNLRIAIDQSGATGNVTFDNRGIILCYKDNTCTIYSIDKEKKTCKKMKVEGATIDSFWLSCIPKNASHLGTFRMGSVDSVSLLLESWIWPILGNLTWEQLVTAQDCLPAIGIQSGSYGERITLTSEYYFDILKKIVDPSVFNPPSYCNGGEQVTPMDEHERRSFRTSFFLRFK